MADERADAEQVERLRRYYLAVAPELAKEREAIDQLAEGVAASIRRRWSWPSGRAENPRPTFVHNRGEFLQPTERVEPGVLSMLPPLPAGCAARTGWTWRAGWSRRTNPLTGRVTMNRHWAAFFGRGIVRTLEDFGYQGEPPTHPELLDWLAVRLVEQGWSIKEMHRLIVTSATYRQSSRVTPELLAKDPENRLLARGPRVRLEAELIRDSALRISGLLSRADRRPERLPAAAARRHDRRGLRRAGVERQPRGRSLPPRASTPSASGPPPTRCSRPSTRPAARSASRGARSRTRRFRR